MIIHTNEKFANTIITWLTSLSLQSWTSQHCNEEYMVLFIVVLTASLWVVNSIEQTMQSYHNINCGEELNSYQVL